MIEFTPRPVALRLLDAAGEPCPVRSYRALQAGGHVTNEAKAAVVSEGHCPDCLGALVAVGLDDGATEAGWCTACRCGHRVSRRWRDDSLAPGWWYQVFTHAADGRCIGGYGWVDQIRPGP
jgi:hypothetical protein